MSLFKITQLAFSDKKGKEHPVSAWELHDPRQSIWGCSSCMLLCQPSRHWGAMRWGSCAPILMF